MKTCILMKMQFLKILFYNQIRARVIFTNFQKKSRTQKLLIHKSKPSHPAKSQNGHSNNSTTTTISLPSSCGFFAPDLSSACACTGRLAAHAWPGLVRPGPCSGGGGSCCPCRRRARGSCRRGRCASRSRSASRCRGPPRWTQRRPARATCLCATLLSSQVWGGSYYRCGRVPILNLATSQLGPCNLFADAISRLAARSSGQASGIS